MKKIIEISLLLSFVISSVTTAAETITGIGATLTKLTNGTVQVVALIPKAPAEINGIVLGDTILEVKSLPNSSVVDVRVLSLPEVVALIRGPVGVPVEISFTRGNSAPIVLSILREQFEVKEDE